MTITHKATTTMMMLSSFAVATSAFAQGVLEAPKPAAPVAKQVESTSDGRIKTLSYDESDVYTIRTKYGYQTNIVLDPLEEIQTVSVGDRSLWQIIPAGNRMFIRPMDEGMTTNMTLITNKRSYEFDLKSVPAGDNSNIYVARFVYPSKKGKNAKATPAIDDMPFMEAPKPAPVVAKAAPVDMRPLRPNYNYTYVGPDAAAPLQVYDDGRFTYLKYRRLSQPLPPVYTVGADGREYPAPVTIQDSSLVISSVVAELVIRDSAGKVKIYNELLTSR